MPRRFPALAFAALLPLLHGGCASESERDRWIEDFGALEDHMAVVYANLDWAVHERGIDPRTLGIETRNRLGRARTRWQARRALDAYVRAYDDPHFRIRKGDHTIRATHEAAPSLDMGTPAEQVLDRLGFRRRDLDFDRLRFDALAGFRAVQTPEPSAFRWGVIDDAEGHRIGVLRIAHFGENGYPRVAEAVWRSFAAAREGECDPSCWWEFRYSVMESLLAQLAVGARLLRDEGIAALVIDVTGNGGGTDWAAVAPRIFAPELRRCPPIGFVRHPHHADHLRARLEAVELAFDASALDDASHRVLDRARAVLGEQLREADSPCDRSALFGGDADAAPCSQLFYTGGCGVLDHAGPQDFATVPDLREYLFAPLRFRYEESVWEGPLFVAIDGGSASATEQFVTMLQVNDAAVLVGERTLGAGCGYIAGGLPLYLPGVDLTVFMPDCVRLRADGRNELEGIEPDVVLPWKGNGRERAAEVIEAVLSRLSAPAQRYGVDVGSGR